MKDKIIKKCYYRITFQLASPLMIGSGYNRYTDSDVLRNGKDIPYIPASAVAGVCIQALGLEKTDEIKYFGGLTDKEGKSEESRVLFYDANISEENQGKNISEEEQDKFHISRRDCVALDEWKTSKKGAKFDMEILEPNVGMVTYLEQNQIEGDEPVADEIAELWKQQILAFGAKTQRGFGAIENVMIQKKTFCLTEEEDVKKWLDFDLYEAQDWDIWETKEECRSLKVEAAERVKTVTLCLKLKQAGGISIRTYTTNVQNGEKANPDSEQLVVRKQKGKKVPVIPGTSWAGAFRHHMEQLIPGCTNGYFGKVTKKEKQKSNIRFSETQLVNAKQKILSRNAIDRFTGGTIDTALFTEKTYYGGHTTLYITLKMGEDSKADERIQKALAASIADLEYGLLAVGGLTSIGRGLFHVEKVNGNKLNWEKPKEAYENVLNHLQKKVAE